MLLPNELGLKACRFQGELFEASITNYPASSLSFIRRFMNSHFAQKLDKGAFLGSAFSVEEAFEELDEQYGMPHESIKRLPTETMFWIGYTYRYFCLATNLSSKQVYRIANGKLMQQLFFPYHTLAPDQAVERIMESQGQSGEDDLIARGVKLMRKAREKTPAR